MGLTFADANAAVLRLTGGVRGLDDLQLMYHQTVGRNCVIELAWSVNRCKLEAVRQVLVILGSIPDRLPVFSAGLVHPDDAAQYRNFGDWIKAQYGPPPHFNTRHVGAVHNQTIAGNASHAPATSQLVVELGGAKRIDRAMVMEDLRYGQRIRDCKCTSNPPLLATSRAFSDRLPAITDKIEALLASGTWVIASKGKSVGHKRIDIFEEPVVATKLRLTVNENQASPVYIRFIGGFEAVPPPRDGL